MVERFDTFSAVRHEFKKAAKQFRRVNRNWTLYGTVYLGQKQNSHSRLIHDLCVFSEYAK